MEKQNTFKINDKVIATSRYDGCIPTGVGIIYNVTDNSVCVYFPKWKEGHDGRHSPFSKNFGHWHYSKSTAYKYLLHKKNWKEILEV